jgi:hypothetical protein
MMTNSARLCGGPSAGFFAANWSAHDWFDEVKAMTAAARCQAELDYDFERGVPFSAFLYQRVLEF